MKVLERCDQIACSSAFRRFPRKWLQRWLRRGELGRLLHELNCADRTSVPSFVSFLVFQIATRLSRNDRDPACPCEFSLKNTWRQLPAEIAINTLFGNKVFSDPSRLLAYAFFETWWLCHDYKMYSRPEELYRFGAR